MPNPLFPRGLRPIASAYGYGAPSGAMQTPVAGGRNRAALQFEGGPQRFNVTIALNNDTRRAIWTLFFVRKIQLGTVTFDMPLDSGFGESLHSAHIVPDSMETTKLGGRLWTVKFTVEAQSQAAAYTDAQVDTALELYDVIGDDLAALLARMKQYVLIDLHALDAV